MVCSIGQRVCCSHFGINPRMTAALGAHALNEAGSQRDRAGLQQARVDVLAPQTILVG